MSTVGTPVRFSRELREICGAPYVVDDPVELRARQILGVIPAVAVQPASPEEVVAVLRLANEHESSVVPAGGLTQQHAGNVPGPIDILLETSRLLEIEHYDPGDLTMGLGAGFTVGQLSDKVAKDGLLFAGDAALPERATVGGLLATGLAGPLRHGYGGLRDYCIGIKFITGDARTGKGGGRVVKNVAGYDMMKLLIGSRGTLAVITGASFKLFPACRQTKTFVAQFATAAEAIAFRDRVVHSPLSPMCLELVSPRAGELMPNDKAAAAWSVCIRVGATDAVLVRYRTELGTAVSCELEGDDEKKMWRRVSDFAQTRDPHCLVLALSLPLTEVLPVLNEFATLENSSGMNFAAVGRIAAGHLLVSVSPPPNPQSFVTALAGARKKLSRDASMSVVYSPAELQNANADLSVTPTHQESMRAIKRALDPKDILNRGRFLV